MEKDFKDGFKADNAEDVMLDLQEVIEIHDRNSLNLARSGGLQFLINFCLSHP